MTRFTDPYAGAAAHWLKGALHVHTTNSDGSDPPPGVIEDYARLGFDFLVLTDHRRLPGEGDIPEEPPLVVIPGIEYRGCSGGPELGVLGIRQPLPTDLPVRDYHQAALDSGGVVIFNHPTWHIHHWPIYDMLALPGTQALEVYNAVCDALPGATECADKWDRLLTCGQRIFGVATDDAHKPEHRNRAWVMVAAEANEPAILAALRAGRFYASNGPVVRSIRVEGGRLVVESEDAQEICFFAERGRMRHAQRSATAAYDIGDDDVYVRAEVFGEGSSKAWTNPVFVESDRSRELSKEFRDWYLAQRSFSTLA